LTGGQKIIGSSAQDITWSASDTSGLSTSSISISYSLDSGNHWTSLQTGISNSGSYTWTTPVQDSNQVRLQIEACDVLGNCSTSTSTDFTIDSTPPTITSVVINDGASYAGTAILGVKIDMSDTLSGALRYKMTSANNITANCQSEFV